MSTAGSAAAETIVRRYYEAFNRGDSEGMLASVSDTIVHDVNQGTRRSGKAQFSSFCADMGRAYQEKLSEIIIMASDDGRRAAAEFIVNGTYLQADEGFPPATGQKYTLPAGAFFEIRDGLITRVTTYYNLREWLRQVS